MFEDWRTEIRALIRVGPCGRTRYTLDLDLEDAEIKIAHPIGELDFQGLAGSRPPMLPSVQRVGLEGRARRFAAHLDNRLYEQAVRDEFEGLWSSFHSTVDDSDPAKRLALNFWLAAHGLGPYMPHPIPDHGMR
jgi:hypothetical protein